MSNTKPKEGRYVTVYVETENVWEIYAISAYGIVGAPAEGRRAYPSYTKAVQAIEKLEGEGRT